jgi:hypothetical protein
VTSFIKVQAVGLLLSEKAHGQISASAQPEESEYTPAATEVVAFRGWNFLDFADIAKGATSAPSP